MNANEKSTADLIGAGRAVLGIEFGSTRIKAVLTDEDNNPIASGEYDWENRLEDGIWTYSMEDITDGLTGCYKSLKDDVKGRYGVTLTQLAAMGVSAMMHGYLAFDAEENLLVPFRTWRNTMTEQAAAELSELFKFNIPQRWSIAHLYQAILNGEEHVPDIRYFTTLAGFVHGKLTGEKVLGIGDASGMFPVDSDTKDYREDMLTQFDGLIADRGYPWKIREILPKCLMAGECAGILTEEGAKFLDPEGDLMPGCPVCPPEGDAGTGMAATNSVAVRTGNVSAGTSIFAMAVLEKDLDTYYEQIDMVTTPSGDPVAMVHCNNCTSDLNAWVGLMDETLRTFGVTASPDELYGNLYRKALEGDPDCGGLMAYNYYSGESITGFEEGRPLFLRKPDSSFTLGNFMRTHLLTSMGALKNGMDILMKREKIALDRMYGHGGLFKTKGVGQRFMAAAIDAPVYVMETAGEGGAWGIALLASYMKSRLDGAEASLADFLSGSVFKGSEGICETPDPGDAAGFEEFMERYNACLPVERAAVENLK